jgi:translation initiation factor IF-2
MNSLKVEQIENKIIKEHIDYYERNSKIELSTESIEVITNMLKKDFEKCKYYYKDVSHLSELHFFDNKGIKHSIEYYKKGSYREKRPYIACFKIMQGTIDKHSPRNLISKKEINFSTVESFLKYSLNVMLDVYSGKFETF